MNISVIIKAEFRIFPEVEFTDLEIIPFSGKFNEPFSITKAGGIYSWSGNFDIAKISTENDTILDNIVSRKAQFRITDGNGIKHLVGTENSPARLTYSREVANNAGGFNGYKCIVTRNAIERTTIEA